MNGVTGRLLASKSQSDVDLYQPIDMLYDENGVYVSYYNAQSLFYEIWSNEIYKKDIESSFKHL